MSPEEIGHVGFTGDDAAWHRKLRRSIRLDGTDRFELTIDACA
jgi:hypothetical protein